MLRVEKNENKKTRGVIHLTCASYKTLLVLYLTQKLIYSKKNILKSRSTKNFYKPQTFKTLTISNTVIHFQNAIDFLMHIFLFPCLLGVY